MEWFDLVIVILVVATLIRGYITGFVMQIASLAGLILGAIFAGQLSEVIAPKLIEWINAAPHIVGPLSYIIAFILIIVALQFAGTLIQSAIKAIKLNTINRIAGALFCPIKWILLVSILLNLILEFDQNQQIIKQDVREKAYTYPLVKEVARLAIPYLKFDWFN